MAVRHGFDNITHLLTKKGDRMKENDNILIQINKDFATSINTGDTNTTSFHNNIEEALLNVIDEFFRADGELGLFRLQNEDLNHIIKQFINFVKVMRDEKIYIINEFYSKEEVK